MTLNPFTPHPSDRCYVLKLDRCAQPEHAALRGRIENLATGRHARFDDGEQLLLALAADLAGRAAADCKEVRHES